MMYLRKVERLSGMPASTDLSSQPLDSMSAMEKIELGGNRRPSSAARKFDTFSIVWITFAASLST